MNREDRPVCPAAVPDTASAPLPGIAILLALLGGGLFALVAAGVGIAGGLAVVLEFVS